MDSWARQPTELKLNRVKNKQRQGGLYKKVKMYSLCRAVLTADEQLVTGVIREGVNLNDRNFHNGMTAVHLAVEMSLNKILKVLIDVGANVNIAAINSSLFTPLISAVKGNNIAIVRQLLNAGADPDKFDEYGKTPLHYAVRYSCDSIEILLDNGAKLDIPDKNGITPLIYAINEQIRSGTDQIKIVVDQLLKRGANPLIADCHGETALHYAARYSVETLELLLSKGVNVDVIGQCRDFRNHQTPLMSAVVAKNKSSVRTLLNSGADVNSRSGDLQTSLHLAQSADMVEILLASGADINAWDMDGYTPLHSATKRNNLDVIEALLTFSPPPPDYGFFIRRSYSLRRLQSVIQTIMKFKPVYYDHIITFESIDPPFFYDAEDFVGRCSLEVERTKEVRFDQLSLFQLLRKGLTDDCLFITNPKICEFIDNEQLKKDFPLYHNILRRHLKIARMRGRLFNQSLISLSV